MKKLLLFPCLFLVCFFALAQMAPVKPNPYYTVQVSAKQGVKGLPIQAFATGRHKDTLLLFSGRTNGFHNFPSPPVASFPSNRSNDSFFVYIPKTGKVYSAFIPTLLTPLKNGNGPVLTTNQIYQLSSTNMQSCQSGDTLYCIGGYGYNGSMVTFGGCFAINVPKMIRLIMKGGDSLSVNVKKAISFATNADLPTSQITGGELLKTNNNYYLVVGQQFNGEYSNGPYDAVNNPTGYQQNYTSTVTPYSFKWSSDTTFTCSAGTPNIDYNNFHRRDLNVVPVVNTAGTKTIHIYGGVFTPTQFGGPYVNPVEITDSTGSITAVVDIITQYFNQYAAAHISLFDSQRNKMFTTILGGITLYDSVASSANNVGVVAGDTSMPWSSIISTMVKDNKSGSVIEYASDNVRLPGLIGGEAKFIPDSELLMTGSDEIIDMGKVTNKAIVTKNRKVKVGIMIGGIVSQLPVTQTRSQTQSNAKVYDVYLTMSAINFKP